MFKKREDKIKKLLLIKGVKLVCIAIEGPDCIGKGTFAKNLHKYLKKHVSELNTDKRKFAKPILVSFPDYNEPFTGQEIKDYLHSDEPIQWMLNDLMIENRYNVFYKIMVDILDSNDEIYNPNIENGEETIQLVVCDRSVFSACNYTTAKNILNCAKIRAEKKDIDGGLTAMDLVKSTLEYASKEKDVKIYQDYYGTRIKASDTNNYAKFKKYINEYSPELFSFISSNTSDMYHMSCVFDGDFNRGIPVPDFLVQVNEDFEDPRSREAHKFTQDARAEQRAKDSNESDEELQDAVAMAYYYYRNIYSGIIEATCKFDLGEKKDMFVPFGTNFGNEKYEEKIFEILKNASYETVKREIKAPNEDKLLEDDMPF